MFYRTDQPNAHLEQGLAHNPFNAIVVPRPIGWISSMDRERRPNLAPYSFFNGVAYDPPQVMFSATGQHEFGGYKDSVRNIEATGEFVVNIATWELREPMNASSVSAPHGIDEFALAGLTAEPSTLIAVPRVKESPIHLECRHTQTVQLLTRNPDQPNSAAFGEVIGIHIADEIIVDGKIDYARVLPIGRLGYMDYVTVRDVFSMVRPTWKASEEDGRPPAT